MESVIAIGVASIGQWDISEKKLISIVNFGNVSDLHLGEELEKRFQKPVFVNNDMNAATMAEKLFGNGRSLSDFIYLGITDGIGAGIVTDNMLYQQSSGMAGEIGHMGIDSGGEKCACGNRGCLELKASITVIEQKLRKATKLDLPFERYCTLPLTPEMNEIFLDMMDNIAYAMVSVINLLNSQAIIIGNEGCFLPEIYISYMEKIINEMKYSPIGHVQVMKTAFSMNTSVYGSVCCVLNHIFTGRLVI